jgi:hypothetical protein
MRMQGFDRTSPSGCDGRLVILLDTARAGPGMLMRTAHGRHEPGRRPVQDERETPPRPQPRPPRRQRVGAVLVVSLVLLVLGGLGWYLLRGPGHRMLPLLADLGVWAAIRTGAPWSGRDLRDGLKERLRVTVAAVVRAARGLAR